MVLGVIGAAAVAAVVVGALEAAGGSTHHAATHRPSRSHELRPTARAVARAESEGPPAAISTRVVSGLGRVLVDANGGRTLYVFLPDEQRHDQVVCKDACATFWVPLKLAPGQKAALALRGARHSLIGSVAAPGGGRVVTYAGHPLYRFQGDIHGGIAKGQAAFLPEPCNFLNLDCSLMLAGPVSYAVDTSGALNKRKPAPDALGP